MKKSLLFQAIVLALLSVAVMLPASARSTTASAKEEPAHSRVIAVIPPDAPPTYFREEHSGKAAGFAVDVLEAVGARAGLSVSYVFEDGWDDIIEMVKSGKADIAPGMGVSKDRVQDLAFSDLIDAFPISFFVRTEHAGIEASSGVHTVGVIRGSVAFEKLKDRANIHLLLYEGFGQGLFDLLAGKIEAFACPAPTLWQLARETGVSDHVKVVDKPIAEITRAIAVRKDDRALLDRLNAAINGFVGTSAYQQVYTKWYGKPVPYWTASRIIAVGAVLLIIIIVLMAVWRYISLLRLNRELTKIIEQRTVAEDALSKSDSFNQSIIDSSSDCIKLLDLEGRLRYMSPGGQKVLGILNLEKYLNVPYEEFWKGSDHEAARNAISLAREGRTGRFQGFCPTIDGTPKWWDVAISPVFGKDARPERLLAVSRDITERRQSAEALRLNQERLESLVAISQRWTESTQELLDFALEEAIRLTRSKIGYIYFYSEEKREFTLNTWSRSVMKECAVAEPETIYHLDRTGIWGEAVRQRRPIIIQDFHAPHPLKKGYPAGHVTLHSFLTVPVFQEDRIVAVVGVANKETVYGPDDISQLTLLMDAVWRMADKKKIEMELRENEAILRSFLNAVTESALILDRQGRILAANETVAKRLGKTAPELVGTNAFDSLPPEVAVRRKVHMDGVIRTGVPVRFEDERLGRVIDNSMYPVFDPAGAVSAVAIIGIDITERKQAVLALEFSEQKYHTLYDSAIDGIFVLDVDKGTFIDVNRSAYERLGYTREELLAMPVSQLDPPDYAAKVGERIGLLRQQGHLNFETAHRKKDGTIMPVEINARTIDYEGRKAIFSIVRDITERKQAEQEREKLIAELQTALAEIKTLHGILPICASCKKIRDDKGAWHQMEVYIHDRTDAEFSHGLCMDCAKKLYPEIMEGKTKEDI